MMIASAITGYLLATQILSCVSPIVTQRTMNTANPIMLKAATSIRHAVRIWNAFVLIYRVAQRCLVRL